MHPVGIFAAEAMKNVIDYRLFGAGEGRADFGAAKQEELKKKFGALINATPSEIAYTANTSDGENIVVMGLDLAKTKGANIVIDELHFTTSLYMYKELEKKGVELRIVKHKNWAIDPEDMAKAIDKNTRLVSMALVSNVNGFMHDCEGGERDRARARGARVCRHHPGGRRGADRRQGARHRLRLVRHLQVADGRTRHRLPLRARGSAGHGAADDEIRASAGVELQPRAADVGAAAGRGAIRDRRHPGDHGRGRQRRHRLRQQAAGSTNIRTHAKQLTDRLQKELPPLGYKPLTPIETPDADRRVRSEGCGGDDEDAAGGHVVGTVIANENRIRLAVSVFNTHDDIDRAVAVLGGRSTSSLQ